MDVFLLQYVNYSAPFMDVKSVGMSFWGTNAATFHM